MEISEAGVESQRGPDVAAGRHVRALDDPAIARLIERPSIEEQAAAAPDGVVLLRNREAERLDPVASGELDASGACSPLCNRTIPIEIVLPKTNTLNTRTRNRLRRVNRLIFRPVVRPDDERGSVRQPRRDPPCHVEVSRLRPVE